MAFPDNNNFKQHRHNGADSPQLDLTDLKGTLDVARGGTGATSLTGILQGNGTSPISPITPSTTISDPSGGGTQDAEARTAIIAILDLLQEQGLME